MALLVTLFLVLVNIFNTVTTNTPKAEGLTAIEAWMLACILFVFGALTEYAGILFRYPANMNVKHVYRVTPQATVATYCPGRMAAHYKSLSQRDLA